MRERDARFTGRRLDGEREEGFDICGGVAEEEECLVRTRGVAGVVEREGEFEGGRGGEGEGGGEGGGIREAGGC